MFEQRLFGEMGGVFEFKTGKRGSENPGLPSFENPGILLLQDFKFHQSSLEAPA
jgi:hypothetical protein